MTVSHRVGAGTPVYKCVKDGQITLTDKPCEGTNTPQLGSTANTSVTVPSTQNPSAVGAWTGQIQYQEVQNGQTVQAAHSVALLKANFTSDGRVTGISDGNGCKWLGVWSGGWQGLVSIDITLSGCAYGYLNRRYQGTLVLARPDSSGQISAQSFGASIFSKDVAKAYDIKGTLRR